jgi:stress response protein SCP2
MKMLECKVRETMDVTEESLTGLINEMAAEGYELDAIHFAMRESSKRPSMAYMIFYRQGDENLRRAASSGGE